MFYVSDINVTWFTLYVQHETEKYSELLRKSIIVCEYTLLHTVVMECGQNTEHIVHIVIVAVKALITV